MTDNAQPVVAPAEFDELEPKARQELFEETLDVIEALLGLIGEEGDEEVDDTDVERALAWARAVLGRSGR